MNIFKAVKNTVTTKEAAGFYGIHVNRNGMCRCPFHEDRNPSMKVDTNFICFGCQEKGDVIRFVSKLFGISAHAAAEKLIRDMDLHIGPEAKSGGRPDTNEKRLKKKTAPGTEHNAGLTKKNAGRPVVSGSRHRPERSFEYLFNQAVRRIYDTYCDYLQLLNEWSVVHAPRSPDEEPHPLFVEAQHKKNYVEYLLDILLYGSEEEQAQIVIENGKGVIELEKRINGFKGGNKDRSALGTAGGTDGSDNRGSHGDAGEG